MPATTILASFNDRQVDPPGWSPLTIGAYEISVTNEPLTVDGLRQPTSMADAIEIAKGLQALPITPAVSDARWKEAANTGTRIPGGAGIGDPGGAKINDPDQVRRWNQKFPNTGGFSDGFWKESVIVPGLVETGPGGLAQYGFRNPDGSCVQHGTPGPHDQLYADYSNTPTYMLRAAKKNGQDVDLLDELAHGCPLGGPLPAWLVQKLRA
jgi:hypothetical protein